MCSKQKRQCTLPLYDDEENGQLTLEQFPAENYTDERISEIDTLRPLRAMKQQYTGTVKLGIEAIEWKVKGFTGKEIVSAHGFPAPPTGSKRMRSLCVFTAVGKPELADSLFGRGKSSV